MVAMVHFMSHNFLLCSIIGFLGVYFIDICIQRSRKALREYVLTFNECKLDAESGSRPTKKAKNLVRAVLNRLVFGKALDACMKGDYALAFNEWKLDAESGNVEAQFKVGVLYSRGTGVAQDHQEAVMWLRRAADQEHADAQFRLGQKYFFGEGVPQDSKLAVMWLRQAARQGQDAAGEFLYWWWHTNEEIQQEEAEEWTLIWDQEKILSLGFTVLHASDFADELEEEEMRGKYMMETLPDLAEVEMLEYAACQGDPLAQINLAKLLMNGGSEHIQLHGCLWLGEEYTNSLYAYYFLRRAESAGHTYMGNLLEEVQAPLTDSQRAIAKEWLASKDHLHPYQIDSLFKFIPNPSLIEKR